MAKIDEKSFDRWWESTGELMGVYFLSAENPKLEALKSMMAASFYAGGVDALGKYLRLDAANLATLASVDGNPATEGKV